MPSAETQVVARIEFALNQLEYNYPEETIGNGETAQQTLERLTWAGPPSAFPKAYRPAPRQRSGPNSN